MNNNIFIISLIFCTLTLIACSTSNHTDVFTPIAPENDNALVYIYRPNVMANAIYSPDLLLNGEVRFSLKNGNKYLLNLPAGDTNFEIEPEKNYSGITQLKLLLEPDGRYYLRIDTTLRINNSTTYEAYQRGFSLVEVDEKEAVAEITKCCYQASKNIVRSEQAEALPEKKDSANSFSVDKTQNPFSH